MKGCSTLRRRIKRWLMASFRATAGHTSRREQIPHHAIPHESGWRGDQQMMWAEFVMIRPNCLIGGAGGLMARPGAWRKHVFNYGSPVALQEVPAAGVSTTISKTVRWKTQRHHGRWRLICWAHQVYWAVSTRAGWLVIQGFFHVFSLARIVCYMQALFGNGWEASAASTSTSKPTL